MADVDDNGGVVAMVDETGREKSGREEKQ